MTDDQDRSDHKMYNATDGDQSDASQERAKRVANLLKQGRDLSRRVEEDMRSVVCVGEADVRLRLR